MCEANQAVKLFKDFIWREIKRFFEEVHISDHNCNESGLVNYWLLNMKQVVENYRSSRLLLQTFYSQNKNVLRKWFWSHFPIPQRDAMHAELKSNGTFIITDSMTQLHELTVISFRLSIIFLEKFQWNIKLKYAFRRLTSSSTVVVVIFCVVDAIESKGFNAFWASSLSGSTWKLFCNWSVAMGDASK